MAKLGFIGCGNMAGAIIGGILQAGLYSAGQIMAADVSAAAREKAQQTHGITTTADNKAAATGADIVVLAVKPRFCKDVAREIGPVVGEGCLVVSIVAGVSLAQLQEWFGRPAKLVRTMPNTPALVGQGMTAMCANAAVSPQEAGRVRQLLAAFGRAEQVEEYMMDAVVAVSGSSPAYVYMLIEAMADGAVAEGLPRDKAYTFAAQAVLGSAKMVLESGLHPGQLKDMVTSPGGTTIEAVGVLEKQGFRGAVMAAMRACAKKNREL